MGENEEKLSAIKDSTNNNNQHGIILGCWDHDETQTLIEDLEVSINLIEIKCKKLLHDLFYYKKYLQELGFFTSENDLHTLKLQCKKNSKKEKFVSGSVPDITLRKNLINLQELEEVFEEKFQEKLLTINTELTNAESKIGIKDNIYLFPTEDYLKEINAMDTDEMDKNWLKERDVFIKINCAQVTTLSDTKITNDNLCSKYSKITQNELESYQKLSRFRFSKHIKLDGKRKERKMVSFQFGRKNSLKIRPRKTARRVNFREYAKANIEEEPEIKNKNYVTTDLSKKRGLRRSKSNKIKGSKSCKRKKKEFTVSKSRDGEYPKSFSLQSTNSNLTSFEVLDEKEIDTSNSLEMLCNSLAEAIEKRNAFKRSNRDRLHAFDLRKQKKVTPFTNSTSAAKSFSVDVNMQQFHSTVKYKKKPASENILHSVTAVNGQKFSNNVRSDADNKTNVCKSDNNSQPELNVINTKYIVTTYPWSPRKSRSSCSEKQKVSEISHKENVWLSEERVSSNVRKSRSKYTKNLSGSCLEYHESTRQYTNVRKSVIESKVKTSYTVDSKMVVSNCQSIDFYEINKQNCFKRANGNDAQNESYKLEVEWTKLYKALTNLHRKYSSLKKQIKTNETISPEKNLSQLENEIDQAIEKYKHFLEIYNYFLLLRQKLKSMKAACYNKGLEYDSTLSSNSFKKLPSKPTSMQLKKTFRQIQVLQDEIRQIGDFKIPF